MPLQVTFKGAPLRGQAFAGGEGLFVPDFAAQVGLDLAPLVAACNEPDRFLSRTLPETMMRGNKLARNKCYVNATGQRNLLARYQFPGHQWGAMLHARDIEDEPALHPLMRTLLVDLQFDADWSDFNHVILTEYLTGTDNIGWHTDKVTQLTADSVIADVSLGASRTFLIAHRDHYPSPESLRPAGGGAPRALNAAEERRLLAHAEKFAMVHGSAVFLSTRGNEQHVHAVLPEPGAQRRISIVARNIKETVPRHVAEKKAAETAATRERRAAQERQAGPKKKRAKEQEPRQAAPIKKRAKERQ